MTMTIQVKCMGIGHTSPIFTGYLIDTTHPQYCLPLIRRSNKSQGTFETSAGFL